MSFAMLGHYIPKNSIIHQLDAMIKIVGLFFLLAAIISSSTLFNYIFMACIVIIISILTKLPFKIVFSSVRRLRFFLVTIFVMNVLFFDGENSMWSWGIFSVSADGFMQG